MTIALTSPTSLITRIDGSETPVPGRWSVVPGHTWLILRTRPGPLATEASAFGAALSGTVDIDYLPQHSRMSLTIDTRRLTCDRPALARALAGRNLRIDAVRTGRFQPGGWDIIGSIATESVDDATAFDAWIDYRGVYRRGHDLAYAWFTMNLTVPATVLGGRGDPIGRRRHLGLAIDLLATAEDRVIAAA